MPKFKMEASFGLKPTLEGDGHEAGIFAGRRRFHGHQRREKDLYISAVIHKAYVDVNEEGTEAAAATAVLQKTSKEPG